jgi:hypothetical protein
MEIRIWGLMISGTRTVFMWYIHKCSEDMTLKNNNLFQDDATILPRFQFNWDNISCLNYDIDKIAISEIYTYEQMDQMSHSVHLIC